MRRCRFFLLTILLLACAGGWAQDTNGVPKELWGRFANGVNVTRWFCYLSNPNDTDHFRDYMVEQDFSNFQRLHIKFIRLCISPEAIFDAGKPKAATVPFLDKALAQLDEAGLVWIYDLHDNGQLKLDEPGHDNTPFIDFWKATARHYRGQYEKSMVFELVNEPVFQKNPAVWYALQQMVVHAIRAIDPERTIMVSGTGWSGIDTLAAMKPLAEKNLIYTFHCYDPFMFTHQGATWVGDQQKALRDLPFPATTEAVNAMIDKIPAQYQDAARWYGKQGFDEKYLHDRIAKGMEFGKQNHVPVVLGEFGAYPAVSPKDSRERWFAAMRKVFWELKVPEALWGYDDALGLGREKGPGYVKLDTVTLRGLFNSRSD